MSNLHGRRKPLNMLEQPQWPEIREGPPRFISARRSRNVDVGKVMMDFDQYPELWGHNILTNSWNDNQTKYGKRPNHTLVVNKEFRPPPQDLEDLLPISRDRRPVVFGRINPGGGYTHAQNTSLAQVDGWLKEDERVMDGSIAPTFESHITFFQPEREPLLSRVLPDHSISAGEHYPTRDEIQPPMNITLDPSIPPVPIHAGFEYPFGAGTPFEVSDLKLNRNLPEISLNAGGNTLPVFTPRELPIYEYTLPRIGEVTAGERSQALGFATFEYQLEEIGIHPTLEAGFETPYRALERPIVSPIERPNLPARKVGSGRESKAGSCPTPDQRRHPEVRRILPRTGFYQIPESAKGINSPKDFGRDEWRSREQNKVGSREMNRAQSGKGQMPYRFEPSSPHFQQKSDAMRHHVWVPSN